MKAVIPVTALKAMLVFAPADDRRKYLNGVRAEVSTAAVTLVATDGSALAVLRVAHSEGAEVEPGVGLIPYEMVKALKTTKTAAVTVSLADGVVSITSDAGNRTMPAIDGKYPDWRRVVPGTLSGEPSEGYDAKLLARFAAFAKATGSDFAAVRVFENGEGAAIVKMRRDDFIGVVMPLCCAKAEHRICATIPPWASTTTSTGQPA